MFKFESMTFNHDNDSQKYEFTSHSFVFGTNTVGKTAMTKAIDFVLGSTEGLSYQGLDHIDSVEAHLTNSSTHLWIKRTSNNEYYYKRTKNSDYSEVSSQIYKDNISLIISPESNKKYITIFKKVFEESPTFRAFSFLNYVDEKNLGDLSVVFTRANELKHQVRIRKIMDFFFNFDNIGQIYERQLDLEAKEKEYQSLSEDYLEYTHAVNKIKNLFHKLQLDYKNDYEKDFNTFSDFKDGFVREASAHSKDIVYLSKVSLSLSEEIKIYSFMKDQAKNMVNRKERVKRLYSIVHSITEQNPEYTEYTRTIEETISEIDSEKVILSLVDYQKSIKKIHEEKEKIDEQIAELKGKTVKLPYEEALKIVGLLEHLFVVIRQKVNTEQIKKLGKDIDVLKKEIKKLKLSFNKKNITKFNEVLAKLYLNEDLQIKHQTEDRDAKGFCLEYDPFRLCLFAKKEENGYIEKFVPGSMARQTHLQMLVYLCLFEYLKKEFENLPILPLLIIDSANQPMGTDIFNKVYPTIVSKAEEIGLQTIFLSKDMIESVKMDDVIDISNGLNRFHINN